MIKEKSWQEKIKAYSLKNAIEHNGKAQEGSVISALFHEGLKKEEVKNIIDDVKKIVAEVNKMLAEQQENKFKELEDEISHRKEREGLPELLNIKGKVVMRFAPFPSGPLHIGNARILILNDEYVKKYKGNLLLIIDDTIGSEEKQIVPKAYKLIEEGVKLLEVKYSKLIKKSDRLNIYYKYAKELIKKDKTYVCSCNAETLRKNRVEEKECGCRKQTVKETLELWKKMFKAKEGSLTLRIKTSMKDKNPAFRDRVLFRISERAHPLVGKKYRVWPLLDFSWAIDDYLLKITHIIRGKELMIETDMESYIFDIFGWKKPEFIHMGLLNFKGIKISKSKSQKKIKSKEYFGWDDPRTWSIQSLVKRGIQPKVLRKFLVGLGINQNEIIVPIDVLYAENRKALHEIARKAEFKKGKGNIRIIMEDGKIVTGNSDIKPKKDEIIHFIGFGYVKFDGNKFYFAHK